MTYPTKLGECQPANGDGQQRTRERKCQRPIGDSGVVGAERLQRRSCEAKSHRRSVVFLKGYQVEVAGQRLWLRGVSGGFQSSSKLGFSA